MSDTRIDDLVESLEIETRPIQAFDRLVIETRETNLAKENLQRLQKLAIRAILSIGGHADVAVSCPDNEIEERALDILDKFHVMQKKAIVAVCFMRLFPESQMKWVTLPPWRPKIITALDTIFKSDAYKEWKIDQSLQPHQKISLLSDVILRQEKTLKDSVAALTSLDTLGLQRQKLMSCLNNKTGRLVFHPFLPGNIESLLADVYSSVQDYLQEKESIDVIDAYTNAIETIERVSTILQSFQTVASVIIAGNLKSRLIRLLEGDFSRNKATQAANLAVEARVKKYPLHDRGRKINIGLLVRNVGPGFSYETILNINADHRYHSPAIELYSLFVYDI